VTVIPGDIIVADDDGAVVLPVALAEEVVAKSAEHHEWEEFSRIRLMEGAPLQRYYPLHADAWPEYEEWRKKNGKA
jgi:regulator of RNase E activity RraA